MFKPWIFAILAVLALAALYRDPGSKVEGSDVLMSVSDQVDPYLQQGMSDETHERIAAQTHEAADWFKRTGEGFGIELHFDAGSE